MQKSGTVIDLMFYHSDHATTTLSMHLGSSSFITKADGKAEQHIQYLPFGELFVSQRNSTFDSRYKFTAKELDNETNYTYFGARYYDSDLSSWLSVDPMASEYPSLSPYNYCAGNPVVLVDPDGRSIGWVGIINSSGNIEWTWNSKINSASHAKALGYDYYSDPGKVINTPENGKVRLGENGQIHVGIVGIHSTGDPQSQDIQNGHAWITISDIEGQPLQSYGLWPDSHPNFEGQDGNGNISDVRIGIELEMDLINKRKTYSYYDYLTKSDAISLTEFISDYSEWYYFYNCSDWACDAYKAATRFEFNNSDYCFSGTPRELSKSISRKLGE